MIYWGALKHSLNSVFQMAALGGFILFFGFFAFNGGSQAQISASGDSAAVTLAIVNTMISASFAGLTCLVCRYIEVHFKKQSPKWSLLTTINGALSGMVHIRHQQFIWGGGGRCFVSVKPIPPYFNRMQNPPQLFCILLCGHMLWNLDSKFIFVLNWSLHQTTRKSSKKKKPIFPSQKINTHIPTILVVYWLMLSKAIIIADYWGRHLSNHQPEQTTTQNDRHFHHLFKCYYVMLFSWFHWT